MEYHDILGATDRIMGETPSLIAIYLATDLYGLKKTLIFLDWLVCEVGRHFVV